MDGALGATDRAFAHAGAGARPPTSDGATEDLGSCSAPLGSTPVAELLTWLDEQEKQGARRQTLGIQRAQALAMIGRFDEARAILVDLRLQFADQGSADPAGRGHRIRERRRRNGGRRTRRCRRIRRGGLPTARARPATASWLSSVVGRLAQALYELDRLDEAERLRSGRLSSAPATTLSHRCCGGK